MGLLSKIGDVLGSIGGQVLSTATGGIIPPDALGSVLGGAAEDHENRKIARAQAGTDKRAMQLAQKYNVKNYKMERRDDRTDARKYFSTLRGSAEKAGFNPLAVLGSGAGSAFGGMGAATGTVPPIASQYALSAGDTGPTLEQLQRDRQRDELEIDLLEIELDKAKAGQAGNVVAKTRAVAGPDPEAGDELPEMQGPPAPDDQVMVRTIDGRLSSVPRSWAVKQKLDTGDATNPPLWSGGDNEEILGEVGGNAATLPSAAIATGQRAKTTDIRGDAREFVRRAYQGAAENVSERFNAYGDTLRGLAENVEFYTPQLMRPQPADVYTSETQRPR